MQLLFAVEEAAGEDKPGLVDPVIGVMIWTLIVFGSREDREEQG